MQMPPQHVPVGQQPLPQASKPDLQVHFPFWQTLFAGLQHVLPQVMDPGGQVHVKFLQNPVEHFLPQAPQLFGSLLQFTQARWQHIQP